ncbi:MAG: cysteine sulfinate desulfinase [Waddliaceae bacterium]|nr:cysteine sulfinate desulfinase [Waddliaceae bacterium]
MNRIYLDNNATTCPAPEVIEVVKESLEECWGNPSSVHYYGQEARAKLMHARRSIAKALGVRATELFFHSGGTEGLNLLIRGLLGNKSNAHVISSNVEHPAVYKPLKNLQEEGVDVTFLEVGEWGAVTPEAVAESIRPNTALIALMMVNNETGVRTDIEAIASIAEERKIPFLVDAVAGFGKEKIVIPSGVNAMVFSGHKFHAPKGIGAAYLRKGVSCNSLACGGGQERGLRPGTENHSGVLALAKAVELYEASCDEASARMKQLRNHFEKALMSSLDGVAINGKGPRVCNTSNLSFEGVDGESLLLSLDLEGVCASHGSACSAGSLEPSRVLVNMGLAHGRASSSVRFSLSRYTTEEEIERAIEIIIRVVGRLRSVKKTAVSS